MSYASVLAFAEFPVVLAAQSNGSQPVKAKAASPTPLIVSTLYHINLERYSLHFNAAADIQQR